MKSMRLGLVLAVTASMLSPVGAVIAATDKPGDKESDQQAQLLIVCRVWAKTNAQVFETETAYWSNYYSKSYDRLIAMGYDPRNITAVQESKSQRMNADMRDQFAMYVDLLNYKLDKQAADYRARTFGAIDKECRDSMK